MTRKRGIFGAHDGRAQAKRDFSVGSPMEAAAGGNKTNIGAGKIDPGGIGRGIEIRRVTKARLGKFGGLLESAPGKNWLRHRSAHVKTKWLGNGQARSPRRRLPRKEAN